MMYKIKKALSFILVLCMLATQLPVVAMAEEATLGFVGNGTPVWEFGTADSWGGNWMWNTAETLNAPAATASETDPAVLTVGGVDALTTPQGDGWSFDAEAGLLTLDGFTYENHNGVYGIYAEGNLRIQLKGENYIDVSLNQFDLNDSRCAVGGIWVNGSLTILGDLEAEDRLIVNADNTMAAIYGYNLQFEDCEDVQAKASMIGVYGDSNLTVWCSKIAVETPSYSFYRGNELAGIHAALGSMGGQTYIYASEVTVDAGLAGIMGVPVIIETSKATVTADSWPIMASNYLGIGVGSEVDVKNTLPEDQFADFKAWTGCPYLVGVYAVGGLEIYDSKVTANAPHFGILEDQNNVLIHGGSNVQSAGGYSGIAGVTGMEIFDSCVYATATFSIEEMLAYMDAAGMFAPPNGMFVLNEGATVHIGGSEVFVEGGFYGIGAYNLLLEASAIDVKNSVLPVYGDTTIEIVDCPYVSAQASEEMLQTYMDLTGYFDLTGAIMSYNGSVAITGCEEVSAQGTMAGICSLYSPVILRNSNAMASGGAYGIAGNGIVFDNSVVQAEAVWTVEKCEAWGAGSPVAVLSGPDMIYFENAATANGEEAIYYQNVYVVADANGNPAVSVKIVPADTSSQPTEPSVPIEPSEPIEPTVPTEPTNPDVIASGVCGENLTWVLNTNGILSISGEGEMEDFEWDNQPWADHQDQITQVVISNGVTSIGDCAFYNCYGLTSIDLPAGIISIGENTFNSCYSLTSIDLPESLTTIGDYAFIGCSGLTNIVLPNGLTSIAGYTFQYCRSLTSIHLPDGITSIGISAFLYCDSLTSIDLPDGLGIIDNAAFYACRNLTEVVIPAGVYIIGNEAFSDCSELSTITFEGGAPLIGDNAFEGVVATAYYPSDKESWTADKLQDYLGSITWVSYNSQLPSGAVSGTCGENLSWILTNNGTLTIFGTGDMTDFEYNSMPWYSYCDQITTVVVEEGVTSIGDYAFYHCENLSSITIPDSITAICDYAFRNCTNLSSVVIPDSVTTIGTEAFRYCYGLSIVTIGNSVISIGDRAFSDCDSLTSVTIPGSVTDIGADAFTACDNLTGIYVDESNAVYSSDTTGVLFNKDKSSLIQAPGSLNGQYTIPDSVTDIGASAFSRCTSLTRVYIPDSITSIGYGAFWACTSLTDVTIPDGVTSISDSMFWKCSSLSSVYISDGVTSIGDFAFYDCDSLTSVTIPDGVISIGSCAFQTCSYLTSVAIGDSVASIGNEVFKQCINLTSVTIPDSVSSIGYAAFYHCPSLTSVEFAGNAPILEEDVFYNDTLTAYYPAGNETWTADVMQNYGGSITWEAYIVEEPSEPSDPNIVASGSCGTDVTWVLDIEGTLEISGTVASYSLRRATASETDNLRMADYTSPEDAPWAAYADQITSVVVDDQVTSIGNNAFGNCQNLKEVSIGASVETIGEKAFHNCANLEKVVIGENVAEVQSEAFAGCAEVTVTFTGDEPAVADSAFENATVTLNYPEGNATWEDASENNYGENVTVQAHTHSYSAMVTAATCEEEGYTTYTCDCGYCYKADYVDATGHVFEDGICTECGYEEITHIPGDINGDGEVNNKDLTRLFQFLSDWDVEVVEDALDINGDGEINNKDLTRLFQYLSDWDVEIY